MTRDTFFLRVPRFLRLAPPRPKNPRPKRPLDGWETGAVAVAETFVAEGLDTEFPDMSPPMAAGATGAVGATLVGGGGGSGA